MSVAVHRSRLTSAAALAAGLAWAVYLYRPFEHSPLPYQDFAILIELLQSAPSFAGRLAALTAHFAAEGRVFVLTNLGVDAHWSMFGWNTAGWQLARFVEMLPVLVLVWYVLRRLGASELGAIFGSALFICTGAAIQVWTLPQLMYWCAALMFVGAVALALDYQASRHWLRRAFGIALLLVGSAYVSENLIATAPFVAALAVCRRPDGAFGLPTTSKRNVALASIIAGAVLLLVVVPVLVLRASNVDTAYASRYSWTNISAARLGSVTRATVLPVTRVMLFPANVAFLGIIVTGVVVAWARQRTQALWLLGVAAILPLAAIVTYLPWPVYEGYYAFQFLLGPAIAAAWALTVVQRAGPRVVRVGTGLAAVVVLAYGTVVARNAVQWERAARRAAVAASTALADYPTATALVASPNPAHDGYVGDGLRRYAKVRGLGPLPRVVDVPCDDARAERSDGTNSILLTLPESCGVMQAALGPADEEISCQYWSRDLKTLRRKQLTYRVSIWASGTLHQSVSSALPLGQGCMRSAAS